MSFNPHAMGVVREILPEVCRGIVSYDFEHEHDAGIDTNRRRELANVTHFDTYDCDFVSYGAASLPRDAVTTLRAGGVPVFCWTVRSAENASKALRYSDQITFENYRP